MATRFRKLAGKPRCELPANAREHGVQSYDVNSLTMVSIELHAPRDDNHLGGVPVEVYHRARPGGELGGGAKANDGGNNPPSSGGNENDVQTAQANGREGAYLHDHVRGHGQSHAKFRFRHAVIKERSR
jgi:hypothetical protein